MSDREEVDIPKAQRILAAVFGAAMTAIGVACCVLAVGFPADLSEHDAFLDQLASDGATAHATLTDKRIETTSDFPIGARGARSTTDGVFTNYAYRFETPDGEAVVGRATVADRLPASVTTVRVYYLPDEPQRHAVFTAVEQARLGFNTDTLISALAFLLIAALGVLFGGVGFRMLRAAYRGKATPSG